MSADKTPAPKPRLADDPVLKAITDLGVKEDWQLGWLQAAEDFIADVRAGEVDIESDTYPGLGTKRTKQVRKIYEHNEPATR